MNENVYISGKAYNFDALVNLMDDTIREQLHSEIAPCSNQEFINAYVKEDQDFALAVTTAF
jgi:hypothetical protein